MPTLVRLDRVFCNKEWDLAFPFTYLLALSSSSSVIVFFFWHNSTNNRDMKGLNLNYSRLKFLFF
jgi:hypothetical protein